MPWRQILRQNFTCWQKLADFLQLSPEQRSQIISPKHFPLNLPIRLASKITKGTLNDPILRQFLPLVEESLTASGFSCDAVGEIPSQLTSKLLHKYQGRALLVCTSACAMHCRYCFRQHYDYDTSQAGIFTQELELISSDPSIHEVLLSGGDPLSLSNRSLRALAHEIAKISHVKRIRFHTRFPIGIPERIDDKFLEILQSLPQVVWFVIHTNHPRELDEEVLASLNRLRAQGVVLLNQSVLLQGVNDDVETLQELCERLADHGIAPYYLHQLDRVSGSAHFEVPESQGRKLIEALEKRLPGYAVPRYVKEISGEPGKTRLR